MVTGVEHAFNYRASGLVTAAFVIQLISVAVGTWLSTGYRQGYAQGRNWGLFTVSLRETRSHLDTWRIARNVDLQNLQFMQHAHQVTPYGRYVNMKSQAYYVHAWTSYSTALVFMLTWVLIMLSIILLLRRKAKQAMVPSAAIGAAMTMQFVACFMYFYLMDLGFQMIRTDSSYPMPTLSTGFYMILISHIFLAAGGATAYSDGRRLRRKAKFNQVVIDAKFKIRSERLRRAKKRNV